MRYHYILRVLLQFLVVALAGALLAGCSDKMPAFYTVAPDPATEGVAEAEPTSAVTALGETEPVPGTSPPTRQAEATTTTPLPSPTWTPLPSPSPTFTPTITPPPSPTALPGAQLAAALRYQTNGDYEQAVAAYQALLAGQPDPDQARRARFHLAECYLSERDYSAAALALEEFIARYPDDDQRPEATLMAARTYHAGNACSRAIPHYQTYLTYESALDEMIYEWIGDCHTALQETDAALAAYRRALEVATDRGVIVGLREKAAGAYLALGNHEAAVAEYDAILEVARIEDYRAKIEYLAGQALVAAGQSEAAYTRYHRVVNNYPNAAGAYLSLIALVDAEVPVDDFQRGLVDYYAGADFPDAYGAAVRAFDRYLEDKPAPKADEALYYRALAQRAMEQAESALDGLETIIFEYPKSQWLARAWFEKAATLALLEDSNRAVRAYQDLAAFFPADDLAPQALWKAARLREAEGVLDEAARLYEELQAGFPAYESADEALWRAGLAYYRAGAADRAMAGWRALLEKYPSSDYRARALFWLGKLDGGASSSRSQAGGRTGGEYWDQLVDAFPRNYYALRVGQLRGGDTVTADRLLVEAVEEPAWDARQDEVEILDWLRTWTQVPTATGLIDLPSSLTNRPDFRRGRALLGVGMRREALAAFDGVRAAAWKDPLTLGRLSLYFREQGLHGLAARCAYRMVGLWPDGLIYDAPSAVQRLAYPLVYADLLSSESLDRGLDPLLLAALIRQESLFEPMAESYAGARGLGQVMPATGEGIAKSLGIEGFVLDDLYRPSVSIRFGAFYLEAQMKRFDNQILVALAAYNGGPGNTLRWLEPSDGDLDLFVEVITASQSQRYLQQVYEQYIFYEALYRQSPKPN